MGVAFLSVFGGNFVLAKVLQGLISVGCLELRGVSSTGQMSHLLYRGERLSTLWRAHY